MKLLEKAQIEGCPALREVKIDYSGRYEKVIIVLNQNRESIEKIQAVVNRVAWGIVTAVCMALIAVVLK